MPSYIDNFINRFLPFAQVQSRRTGVDPYIILGQAAHESNWGRQAPNNNLFGIQGGPNRLQTQEFINGRMVTTTRGFRGYTSQEQSFEGYGDFILRNQRYGAFRSAANPQAQIAALGRSGYASDPNYASSIGRIRNSITSRLGDAGSAIENAGNSAQRALENIPGMSILFGIRDNILGQDSPTGSCGANPFCYLKQWMNESSFFQRIAMALFAFIVIFAAFYLMKEKMSD